LSLRSVSKSGQSVDCSFDQFLDALDNPALVFAEHDQTAGSRVTSLPFAAPDSVPAMRRRHSAMMAPAECPFWIGVVRSMRARQDWIGVACLFVAMALFIMIAGRLAWAYAVGVL